MQVTKRFCERSPHLYTLRTLNSEQVLNSRVKIGENKWVPLRPIFHKPFWQRVKIAWMVFKGEADAVLWPEDDLSEYNDAR